MFLSNLSGDQFCALSAQPLHLLGKHIFVAGYILKISGSKIHGPK